ncbi:MAG: ATP-binding protein [Pseudomonadota bacterium]|nr:ATP-binding protein [Pseudomonadota bacterium]
MLTWLRQLSIRAKLMWLVLALLIIPWMGTRYVQEMKEFLLRGQKDAMLLTASGIATVLNDRTDLFAPDTGVPELLGGKNDLYADQLSQLIHLDGESTDWSDLLGDPAKANNGALMQRASADPDSLALRYLVGYRGRYLYTLLQVTDPQRVLRDPAIRRLDTSDQIRMVIQQPGSTPSRYLLVTEEPGPMSIYLMDEAWQYPLSGDPVTLFKAALGETPHGYTVEVRIPRYFVGPLTRLGFTVTDVDDAGSREIVHTLSTFPDPEENQPGRVLLHSPELEKILHGLDRPGSRIWVLDRKQQVRAVVGALSLSDRGEERGWLQQRLDTLLKRPVKQFQDLPSEAPNRPDQIFTEVLKGAPQTGTRPSVDAKAEIVMAGYPLRSGDEILGAVVVEQSSNVILAQQHRLLRRVTTATLLVFAFVAATLFIFAWRLTVRIRRLHSTTEKAISPEGKLREEEIPSRVYPADELGDLGRSITSMLKRLAGYTRYLEGMPDTLAHELKNPLNVVSSSLQNLQMEQPEVADNRYLQRAQNGVNRLRGILNNLTEAANLEEAMWGEEKERLDLAELINGYLEGLLVSQPEYRFGLRVENSPLLVDGAPDHLAQMLDKLLDNAVEFSGPGTKIDLVLRRNGDRAEISVLNEGPELPPDMREKLFDPMVSVGKKHAQQSHLGLGLFVVRLIADFHQGEAWAENRTDLQGVKVTVSLPLASGRQEA